MTKPRVRPYLGHALTKKEQSAVTSLIGFTGMRLGFTKRRIKSEAQLWDIVEAFFGMRPMAGEEFPIAVKRIRNAIAKIPAEERSAALGPAAAKLGIHHREPGFNQRINAAFEAKSPRKPIAGKQGRPTRAVKDAFYRSWDWRQLRMEVLQQHGRRCLCCGAQPGEMTVAGTPVRIVVDHIKPLSLFWSLRLTRTNLQVLCDECNQGKGAWDQSDYRPAEDDVDLDDIVTDPLTAEYRAIMFETVGQA